MRVPLAARAGALALLDSEPSAFDFAAWYGHLHAPPTLSNREGEPLVLCRTVLEVAEGVDAPAALDELLERSDEVWHEHFELDSGERVIRGSVSIDDGHVVVETNSERRHERLVGLLVERLGAAVVDERRQAALDAVRDRRAGASTWELDDDEDDDEGWSFDDPDIPPEVAAALEEHMVDYELRWLDMELPALGGMTPRQAHTDPTRREDLAALLRDIRRSPGPMSADRIEALLEG